MLIPFFAFCSLFLPFCQSTLVTLWDGRKIRLKKFSTIMEMNEFVSKKYNGGEGVAAFIPLEGYNVSLDDEMEMIDLSEEELKNIHIQQGTNLVSLEPNKLSAEEVKQKVKEHLTLLGEWKDTVVRDHDVGMQVLKKRGYYLGSFSDELKNDKEIVSFAFEKDTDSLEYAGEKVTSDKEFVLGLMERNRDGVSCQHEKGRRWIKYVDNTLKKDNDFASKIVKYHPEFFKYMSNKVRNNKKLVSDLIGTVPLVVAYSNIEDSSIWVEALMNCDDDASKMIIISESKVEILNKFIENNLVEFDYENLMAIFTKMDESYSTEYENKEVDFYKRLMKICPDIVDKPDFVMELHKKVPRLTYRLFPVLSNQLRDNKELVLQFVSKNGHTYEHASLNVKNDVEVATDAFQSWKGDAYHQKEIYNHMPDTVKRFFDEEYNEL